LRDRQYIPLEAIVRRQPNRAILSILGEGNRPRPAGAAIPHSVKASVRGGGTIAVVVEDVKRAVGTEPVFQKTSRRIVEKRKIQQIVRSRTGEKRRARLDLRARGVEL